MRICKLLFLIIKNQEKIMGDLTKLTADESALAQATAQAVTLLQNLSSEIANLPANDQPAIDALAAKVESDTAALVAGITAATPPADGSTPPADGSTPPADSSAS